MCFITLKGGRKDGSWYVGGEEFPLLMSPLGSKGITIWL